MEQHPVPQPISSYEFRLIGSMTLKQFTKLAANLLVALVFYALPFPSFIKWPAITIFALLGVGMAFLPINERPLDLWMRIFLRAIYSPTQYIWRKNLPTLSSTSATPLSPMISSPPPVKIIKTNNLPPPQKIPIPQPTPVPIVQTIPTAVPPATAVKNEVRLPASPPPEEKKPETVLTDNLDVPLKTASLNMPPVVVSTAPPPVAVAPKPLINNFVLFSQNQPNIITGIIKDKQSRIIEGAILEIKDAQGTAVRALKSNKLGQFRIATPLTSGEYQIEIEKEGHAFDIIKVNLTGGVFSPIEINPK